MPRPWFAAAVISLALALGWSGRAIAGGRDDAERKNDEGKALFQRGDFQGAAAKFREALTLARDPRYDFNLCAALEKAGDWDAALEACDQVFKDGGDAELRAKAGTRAAAIREARRNAGPQGTRPPPPGSPPVALPPPPPGSPTRPVQPPPPALTVPTALKDPGRYRWALGLDVGPTLWGHTIADPTFGRDRDIDVSPRVGLHFDLSLTRSSRWLLRAALNDTDGADRADHLLATQDRKLNHTEISLGVVARFHLTHSLWLHADAGLGLVFADYQVVNENFVPGVDEGENKEKWLSFPAQLGVELAMGSHVAIGLGLTNDLLIPVTRSRILHGSLGDTLALMFTLEFRVTSGTKSALPQVELQ